MSLNKNCGASGCRVLLGNSNESGVNVNDNYHSDNANNNVGLLAGWNFCLLFSFYFWRRLLSQPPSIGRIYQQTFVDTYSKHAIKEILWR